MTASGQLGPSVALQGLAGWQPGHLGLLPEPWAAPRMYWS